MKNFFTAKRLCRAGVIAALYVALTYAFSGLSYQGILQIRPAEALCVLPLFFVEAVPALYLGCVIANLGSPFVAYDATLGALCTLVAALGTYFIGVAVKNKGAKLLLGGAFPVVVNALIIPLIIVFLCGDLGGKDSFLAAYGAYALSLFITQSVWVYGLGTPLYLATDRLLPRLKKD